MKPAAKGLVCLLVGSVAAGTFAETLALGPMPRSHLESGYSAELLFDHGSGGRWDLGEAYTALTLNRSYYNWDWKLALRYTRPHGEISYYQTAGLDMLVRPPGPDVRAFLSTRSGGNKISAGVWWQVGTENQNEAGISGQWQPAQNLWAGLEYSRRHPVPCRTELYYDGEGGPLQWSAPASTRKYAVRLTPARWWSIFSEASVANLSPGIPQDGSTLSAGYLAAVDGLWRDRLFRIETCPSAHTMIVGEYREVSADMHLQGFSDGHRFGHFGVVEFAARLWSLRFTLGHLYVKLEKGKVEGALAGTVEAWPFTEGLARFIGERRHLIGTGILTWKGAGLHHDVRTGRHVCLRPGLKYLHLEPDVRYSTWRPLAFGLGIDDLRWGRLEVRSAHLLHIALDAQLGFRQWSLKLAVGQWIPLAVRKEAANPGGNTEDLGVSRSSAPVERVRHHGGFSFSASLSFSL